MFEYNPPAGLLQDRVILVTGAGDGLGRAAALSYAAHGATVVLLGKTVKKLENVYDEIENAGGPKPAIFPLDLEWAQEAEYGQLADSIEMEFGSLHGILHNAGILGLRTPIQSHTLEIWNQVIQINLNAAFAITRQLMPIMQRADDASIVFTSSGVGRKPRAYWGAYAVSKAALEALMQILHQELENTSSIRVNTLNPGPCATGMRRQAYPAEDPATLSRPEDLMNAYLYLMGPDSKGESGQQFNAQ